MGDDVDGPCVLSRCTERPAGYILTEDGDRSVGVCAWHIPEVRRHGYTVVDQGAQLPHAA